MGVVTVWGMAWNDTVHMTGQPRRRVFVGAVVAACAFFGLRVEAAGPAGGLVQFNRDVRPFLSDKCFACHGFDARKRKGGLRLDTVEGAYGRGESGSVAVVPGDPAGSELWRRVNSDDREERMPPAKAHKTLTDREKVVLRKWIEQGAPYEGHWAFQKPVRPAIPGGEKNPVDAFLLERLKTEGMSFSAPATREAWIRRVTLALTGLPPTIPELDAFLKDNADGAEERVVDRLLASPKYGEQMARHWLDVARYGDTHGLHLDNERSIWPYRDWVIGAFNRNLSFDRFTVEQLAGDLLPEASPEQLLATGFNRCNVTTSEGGAIAEEFLFRYAVDRTSTLAQAWLGLTFNWGALLGFAAASGQLSLPALLLYASGVFWTLGYDTIYAIQDIEDDALAGVKSSARRLGEKAPRAVASFYLLALAFARAASVVAGLGLGFSVGLIGLAIHLGLQARRVRIDDGALALKLFRSNTGAGLILFAAIVAGSWVPGS